MKRYPKTHTLLNSGRRRKHAQPNRAPEKGWGFTWVGEHGELDPLVRLTVEPITAQRALTADDLEGFARAYGKLEPDDAIVHPASINIETLSPLTHEEAIADVKKALEDRWVERGTTEGGIRVVSAADYTPTPETMGKIDQVRILASRDFKAYAALGKGWMRKLSRRQRSALLRRIWRRS